MTTLTHSTLTSPLCLFVGGEAGYIGSYLVKHLLCRGCYVATFDNLSTGHRDVVLGGEFVLGDLVYRDTLDSMVARAVRPSTRTSSSLPAMAKPF
jgi:UDP-glucose 4-epimerase